jgi:hypothetical protein
MRSVAEDRTGGTTGWSSPARWGFGVAAILIGGLLWRLRGFGKRIAVGGVSDDWLLHHEYRASRGRDPGD